MADSLAATPGKDHVSIVAHLQKNGFVYRLKAEEGVLRAIVGDPECTSCAIVGADSCRRCVGLRFRSGVGRTVRPTPFLFCPAQRNANCV